MTKLTQTVDHAAFAALMREYNGDLLRITLDDRRVLVGRSTGHVLQVQVGQRKFELVRVSAFNVVSVELV